MNDINVIEADLNDPLHADATLTMMDAYARDPMGDGNPLSDFAVANLISGLLAHPTTAVFLAFSNARPIGIATCFRGFSTFAAKSLLNISDFYVDPEFRGNGVGRALLAAVESAARQLGCCKLTLEVQEHNAIARHTYGRFGFSQAVHVPEAGGAIFLVKPLQDRG